MEEPNKIHSSFDNIDIFIKTITETYKDNSSLKIIGKQLHYIKDTIMFQFYITIYKSTKINPFDVDICLFIEFYENRQPYVHIINDFLYPTLNDGRNIFCCLTNKHNYLFNRYNLSICERIFDELINGLNNFLLCLKENKDVNIFIYYGEYEIGRTYQINDFLLSQNTTNFYRINVIHGKNEEMKYIVITQLFFLLFNPEKEDMSLADLELFYYLKDIQFSSYILKNNKKYNLTISNEDSKDKINSIDFYFIENISEDNTDNNNENDIKYNEFKNTLLKKKNEIHLKKYKFIITNYKPLFTIDIFINSKGRNIEDTNMSNDYKLYISYFEELIKFYEHSKDESVQKRVKLFREYLNYCYVDFITYNSSNTEEVKLYQSKILQYANKDKDNDNNSGEKK